MSSHAHRVVTVRYGELSTTRSDIYLNYGDYGEPDGPDALSYYFWVVFGESGTVVLDTGFHAEVGVRTDARTGCSAPLHHPDPAQARDRVRTLTYPEAKRTAVPGEGTSRTQQLADSLTPLPHRHLLLHCTPGPSVVGTLGA